MKRALVSGAAGFVGAHLVRRLIARGVAVDAVLGAGTDAGPLADLGPGLGVVRHDGTTEQLAGLVARARPDVVFHLAARFVARHARGDIEPLIASNLLFATQLADAAARAGVRFFVNAGTSWQHETGGAVRPVCLYAATKQAFESVLGYYARAEGLRVVTLKLFDSYGPRDRRGKLFDQLRRAARTGERLALSPGAQLVDLVYVDDIARALEAAAARLEAGRVAGMESYAVSSGRPRPLREIVETYARITGARLDLAWGARPYREREIMVPWRGGPALPGWAPEVGLEEGIRRMEADPV